MEEILQFLKKINYWEGKPGFDTGFVRIAYLNELKNALDNKLIKVVVGQRRSGKSYIVMQLIEELIDEKGVNPVNIFYLNKELYEFEAIGTAKELAEIIGLYKKEYKPEGKVYVLIDEIQNIN